MNKEEFNLSKKIYWEDAGIGPEHEALDPEDVKEFIKRLKEKIKNVNTHKTPHIFYLIDKLAGDKLI